MSAAPPLVDRGPVARAHRSRRPPRVRLARARDAAEYREALLAGDRAAGGGATAFHSWSWLHFQAQLGGWRVEPLVARVDGRVVGAAPLLLTSGLLPRPAPVAFPYLGPVVDPELFGPVLDALRRWCAPRGVRQVVVGLRRPTAAHVEALVRRGALVREEDTYVVPLPSADPDVLLAAMRRGARGSVRGAVRAGATVRDARREDVAQLLPLLLAEAFGQRGQDAPLPPEVGERAWDELVAGSTPDGLRATAVAADVEGRCVGLLVLLDDASGAYGWAGGSLREVRSLGVNHLLNHASFVRAARDGHDELDLVAGVDAGIASFKAGLGGRPSPFATAELPSSRAWSAAARPARAARAALGRLGGSRHGAGGRRGSPR